MLLEVKNLDAFYGVSQALRNVSLNVDQGEIVALLGRNGMGKSTTLKSIIGLVKPRSGSVIFKGRDVAGQPPYRISRKGIGLVPEDRWVFPTLTVTENLLMGVKKGIRPDDPNKEVWTVERLFDHFSNLRERSKSLGKNLSGGEQQMLALARTLMGNPDLILVDEPMEGLAPIVVNEIKCMLQDIHKTGVSILLVEHNYRIASSLASRIYLMGKGYIGYEGTPETLDADPEMRQQFLEV